AALGADADRLAIVHEALRQPEERWKWREVAGVEAVGIARLAEELLRLRRIVGRRLVGAREFEDTWDEAARRARHSEGLRLIERVAVERVAGGKPHAPVVPRRFWIPLLVPVCIGNSGRPCCEAPDDLG